MTDLPAVDLIEGRRLLDAYKNVTAPEREFLDWLIAEDNAEAMLTLLEQARLVLAIFDKHERNERGEQTYIESDEDLKELARLGASVYRTLTPADAKS